MRLTAGRKPISSIWSASSKTKNFVSSNRNPFWSTRSSSLPGVATKISTPLDRSHICFLIGAPPIAWVKFNGNLFPKLTNASWICSANSRVGERIIALAERPFIAIGFINNCWINGNANAAVLPVPVWASPTKSLLFKTAGIAWDWIGVGNVYPRKPNALTISASRPNFENALASDLGCSTRCFFFSSRSFGFDDEEVNNEALSFLSIVTFDAAFFPVFSSSNNS